MHSLDTVRAPISTGEFYEELTGIDFSQEGPRIRIYSVDLDPEALLNSIAANGTLQSIASRDGAVSHVKERPASAADNSASSRYFSLHTDGKYLPSVPEMVILHCVDPGTSGIPTIFVDTKDIMDALDEADKMEEAEDYELIFTDKEGRDFVRPLVETNPQNEERVMNIAIGSPQCRLRPRDGSDRTQDEADEFYALLDMLVEEDIPIASHEWAANDAVVFDNLRLIHGRGLLEHKALEISDIQRHLHRIWLSRQR